MSSKEEPDVSTQEELDRIWFLHRIGLKIEYYSTSCGEWMLSSINYKNNHHYRWGLSRKLRYRVRPTNDS